MDWQQAVTYKYVFKGIEIDGFELHNKGLEHIIFVHFFNLWDLNLDHAGDMALKVPENYTVTSADFVNHSVVFALAAGNIHFLLTTPTSIHHVPKSYIAEGI